MLQVLTISYQLVAATSDRKDVLLSSNQKNCFGTESWTRVCKSED